MIPMWDQTFGIDEKQLHRASDAAWETMVHELMAGLTAVRERLVPGGFLCLNIGDALRSPAGRFRRFPNAGALELGIARLDLELLPAIHWYKPTNAPNKFLGSGMLPGAAYVTLEHERILVARCPGERKDSDFRDQRRASALFWAERNRFYSDHWQLGAAQQLPVTGSARRTAAFPPELPFRLILMYSVYGDCVLDPYGGTGTTGAAAIAAGRNSVCVEQDPVLCDAALERLRDPRTLEWAAARAAGRIADRGTGKHVNRFYGNVHTSQETDLEIRAPLRFRDVPGPGGTRLGSCPQDRTLAVEHAGPLSSRN